jgi:hypothetical protein
MRHAARSDSTQSIIIAALKAIGASVKRITSPDESGCWDLLVGFRRRDFKLEVKGPNTPLSPAQVELHATWRGAPTYVVRTPDEALRAIGAVRGPPR